MITLRPYQEAATRDALSVLATHQALLDASDTGTGKTYVACAVSRLLFRPVLIVAPKAIKAPWMRIAKEAGLTVIDVVTPEKIRAGRSGYAVRTKAAGWVWLFNCGVTIIWDECHRGQASYDSQLVALLASLSKTQHKVILLSATAAQNPMRMRATGTLLRLFGFKESYTWCLNHGCYRDQWGGLSFRVKGRETVLKKIHGYIFPSHGIRIRIKDLPPGEFPENEMMIHPLDVATAVTDEANALYVKMHEDIRNPTPAQTQYDAVKKEYAKARKEGIDLGVSEEEALGMVQVLPIVIAQRARQTTEMLKVPALRELAFDLVEEGKHVVVFLSFRDSMTAFASYFTDLCRQMHGSTSDADRKAFVDDFAKDLFPIACVQLATGGIGIGLHDRIGNYPRVSLISPDFSAEHFIQACGRIFRQGGKTPCVQKVVYLAGTIEEEAALAIESKLSDISLINDGDVRKGFLL